MTYLRKVLRNTIWNWANLVVALVISFLLAPFVLHRIGDGYYGVWALATQIAGYLWLLDFGARESVVKYVAEYHSKQDTGMLGNVVRTSLKVYSMVCLICVALSVGLAIAFPFLFKVSPELLPTTRAVVIITGINISQSFVFNVFLGILMGLQRYDVFSKISIVFSILKAIFTVVFLAGGYGLIALSLIQLFSDTCMNFAVFAASRRLLPIRLGFRFRERKLGVYRMLVNYGFYAFLNSICLQIVFNSANFIIAAFLPISSVTFYAIAANLIEYMKRLIVAGTQALNPLTSELAAKAEAENIVRVLIQGTRYSFILGLPVAVMYFFLGQQFIGLWMGLKYAETTGNILALLTIVTLFSLPHYTVSSILFGLNKHWIIACCRIGEACLNIGLSILFVKKYGVFGVALGGAIPHLILVVVILPIVITRTVRTSFSNYLLQGYYGTIGPSLPFMVLCYLASRFFTPSSLTAFLFEVVVLLAFYLLSMWFLALAQDDRRMCVNAICRLIPSFCR